MGYAPIMRGPALIEIERSRYDELIAKETELQFLKNSLGDALFYSEVTEIKKIFNITPTNKEATESEEK